MSDSQDNIIRLHVFGFYITTQTTDPDFFMVMVCDYNAAVEVPLQLDGRMLIVYDFDNAPKIVEIAKSKHEFDMPKIDDVYIVDLNQTIDMLRREEPDNDSLMINTINWILEIVKCLDFKVPEQYLISVKRFADHITFDNEYYEFFIEGNYNKRDVIDGLIWIAGAMMLSVYPVDEINVS